MQYISPDQCVYNIENEFRRIIELIFHIFLLSKLYHMQINLIVTNNKEMYCKEFLLVFKN